MMLRFKLSQEQEKNILYFRCDNEFNLKVEKVKFSFFFFKSEERIGYQMTTYFADIVFSVFCKMLFLCHETTCFKIMCKLNKIFQTKYVKKINIQKLMQEVRY